MTNKEAIEILTSDLASCYECTYGCSSVITCEADCGYKDAMKVAIESLQQKPMTLNRITNLMAARIAEIDNKCEIARKAGCSRNTILSFLNGTELRYGLFFKLLDALDLEVIVRRKGEYDGTSVHD